MSNRTDFDNVAIELQRFFGCTDVLRDRIAVELHDAFVAGQESKPIQAKPCTGCGGRGVSECGRCAGDGVDPGTPSKSKRSR